MTATLQDSPLHRRRVDRMMVTMLAAPHDLDRISPEASRRPSMRLEWQGSSEADNRLVHSADNLGSGGTDRQHLIADML